MNEYKKLKRKLILLSFIHKRSYYLLIIGILSLCLFFTFFLFVETFISMPIFILLLSLDLVLFIVNAFINNLIKESASTPYILDIAPEKNDMEVFSIETSAKRKIMGSDTFSQFYLYQKLTSRTSGHIPELNISPNYPRNLMPSLVGHNIYCNYYINIYNYQNKEFQMANYKDIFYQGRFNLHKENAYCNSMIIDLIIVDNLNEELNTYLSSFINAYLFEPCVYAVICDGKLYLPPISKDIKYEYQLDAYKEAIKYLKDTLL